MSWIVTEVSAMLVVTITFFLPAGGSSKTLSCSSFASRPYKGRICKCLLKGQCKSLSTQSLMIFSPGRKMRIPPLLSSSLSLSKTLSTVVQIFERRISQPPQPISKAVKPHGITYQHAARYLLCICGYPLDRNEQR